MKKFFLFLLAAICAVCMGVAVGCAGDDGEYYSLVFRQTNGVTYNCEIPSGVRVDIPSGVEVRAGTEIKFTITLSEDALGIPVVYKNDVEFTANENNEYSFVIEENTVIKVLGIDASGGEYNRIIFGNSQGANVKFTSVSGDSTLQNGMLVRNGTEVEFEVTLAPEYFVEPKTEPNDAPLVKVNDTVLQSKSRTETGWLYSFIMNGRTEIQVEHIKKNIKLTYVNGDTRVRYFDSNGHDIDSDTELPYKTGDEINFKVQISSYYNQEEPYEVQANSDILTQDSDGLYHYTLKDDTSITVNNLVLEKSFTERDEYCGAGTEGDPFQLSRPVDLYQMAGIINGTLQTGSAWRHGYYVLTEDIDLQGEQLFIIGTAQNDMAYFAGHFDGQGHKISNFYIEDTFVDQDTFNPMVASSVGMFGTVTPISGSDKPEIRNLTLEDYEIHADASQYTTPQRLSVGSFVGMGYGVDIVNCYAKNGTLNVTGGQSAAYVGGIIGQQVSAYSTTGAFATESKVIGCGSDVEILVPSSSATMVYSTGGITGLLGAGERSVSAYVLNSYFTGTIRGGLHAGGVVGYASDFTSVIDSYSAGSVLANSPFTQSGLNSYVYNAYAAGVVAELGYDAIVYGCFSTSKVEASTNRQGATAVAKPVVALMNGENDTQIQYGYNKAVEYNNLPETNGGSLIVSSDNISTVIEQLNWNADDWDISNGYPVPKNTDAIAQRNVTISFNASTEFGSVNAHSSKGYKSLAEWGKIDGNDNIPEYLQGNGSYRSYGYYFNDDYSKKVPLGFVFTRDITLYIASADYGEVAGTYYLGNSSDVGAYMELKADGTMFYRNGAVSQETTYKYTGTELVLFDTVLSELTEQPLGNDAEIISEYFSVYYNFGAKKVGNVLTIEGGYVDQLERVDDDEIGATGNTITLFPHDQPLKGLKAIENLKYGEYYLDDANKGNTVYGFNGNGTGYKTVKGTEPQTTSFTYDYEGTTITITYSPDNTETATIGDGVITAINSAAVKPYDGFTGDWEAAYGISGSYNFDGISEWTSGESKGSYTIADGKLTTTDFTAQITDEGFLKVEKEGKTVIYYRKGSFTGEWYFSRRANNSSISVSLVLKGLTNNGYGEAVATLSSGEVYELNYEKTVTNNGKPGIILDRNEIYFGTLEYDDVKSFLSGDFTGFDARFTAYDTVMGSWIADDETLYSLSFNGNGFYDLSADNQKGFNAVKAKVQVVENAEGKLVTKTADYRIDRTTMSGKITYKNGDDTVEYTITYKPETDTIELKKGEQTITVQHRDEWFGVELKDQSNNILVFDGRGRLTKGEGKLTIYGLNDRTEAIDEGTYKIMSDDSIQVKTKYTYKGDAVIKKGVRSVSEHPVYYIEGQTGGDIILYKNVPFAGDWLIGTVRGELKISEVYADDTATGSYKLTDDGVEQNVNFNYHADGNYLSFTYGENKTYYINALEVLNDYRLSFGPDNTFSSANNYTCVVNDKEHKDEWYDVKYYVYDPETDTDIGRFVFDGLGKSTTGNVTYYGLAEQNKPDYNNVKRRHSYTIANYGYGDKTYHYCRIFNGFSEYLLIPCEKGEKFENLGEVLYNLHDGNQHYFAVVYPDALYGLTVKDSEQVDRFYIFDGVGGVTAHGGNEGVVRYKYTIEKIDREKFIHDLVFTVINSDGTLGDSYKVKLDQSSDIDSNMWQVKLGDKIETA